MLCPQRISLPLKKRYNLFSEGNAVHPFGCFKKERQTAIITYMQQAVTPDQVTRQNSLQRAGGPKMQLRHFEA
jgi:hypothetical protein